MDALLVAVALEKGEQVGEYNTPTRGPRKIGPQILRGEEEQGSGAEISPQAEAEQSGLCDDEDQAEDPDTGRPLGWRMTIPGFDVEEIDRRYEVHARREGEVYVIGVSEKGGEAGSEGDSDGAERNPGEGQSPSEGFCGDGGAISPSDLPGSEPDSEREEGPFAEVPSSVPASPGHLPPVRGKA